MRYWESSSYTEKKSNERNDEGKIAGVKREKRNIEDYKEKRKRRKKRRNEEKRDKKRKKKDEICSD